MNKDLIRLMELTGYKNVAKKIHDLDQCYPENCVVRNNDIRFDFFEWAIRMEILQSYSFSNEEQELVDLTLRPSNEQMLKFFKDREEPLMMNQPNLAAVTDYLDKNPILNDTLLELYQGVGEDMIDLHENNFMKRNNTLVITDPYQTCAIS